MKALPLLSFVGAAWLIAVAPVAATVYAEAYPADPARAAALAACARDDPGFDRLHAADRAACYRRRGPAPGDAAAPAPHGSRTPQRRYAA